ncbi:MAG: alcohol dehydrogenase [Sphingomonas sp.]|nr:MAG: alcohol dehydrogenase [Sphingomonas sp.]
MQALIYRDGRMRVCEAQEPRPAEGQVLVKTLACGICGSDLHFVHHAHHVVETSSRIGGGFPIDLGRDIVLGHEFCGEVVERGRGPGALPAGTRVCSVPFTHAAGAGQSLGFSAERPGGYGQYMVLNECNLVPVPNGLSAEHAALTEPMAVGLHAVNRARIAPDDVALVIGCGPIGLAVIAALRIQGVRDIIAADFSASRRRVAEAIGATVVVDPATASPYASWASIACPQGYQPGSLDAFLKIGRQPRPSVIFECVGVPGMLQRVFEGALAGTRIVVVGVCMEPDRFEPLFPLNKENDVIFCFYYSGEEYARSLHHIGEGLIDVTPLLSRTVGLGEAAGAFAALESGAEDIKIIVDPWK